MSYEDIIGFLWFISFVTWLFAFFKLAKAWVGLINYLQKYENYIFRMYYDSKFNLPAPIGMKSNYLMWVFSNGSTDKPKMKDFKKQIQKYSILYFIMFILFMFVF